MANVCARRLAASAALIVVAGLMAKFLPAVSDNVLVDILLAAAIYTAAGIPLIAMATDPKHDQRPISGQRRR